MANPPERHRVIRVLDSLQGWAHYAIVVGFLACAAGLSTVALADRLTPSAAQHLHHRDMRDTKHRCYLAGGVTRFVRGTDSDVVVADGGSAPTVRALQHGKRTHLTGLRGDRCLETSNGARGARVVQRDGDAEFAGGVAERGVLTLLTNQVLVSGHAGNLRYQAGFVKGCPNAQKAITYYRRAYTSSRSSMNLTGAPARVWYQNCNVLRRRATMWRDRAHVAARELAAWQREWAAPPEPFLSIARCENRGNGAYGVNWDAYNSVYEGAYGFLHSTWDGYKPRGFPANANEATIRQQTDVARILVAEFGGYSSWPACHIRLGLPG